MKSWQPGKNTSDPYFCNQEFRNNNHFNKFSCEVILTSESKDFEIKDHFSRFLCQADSLPGFHFENHFGCALVPEKGLRRLQQKQNKTKQKNSKTYKTKQKNSKTYQFISPYPHPLGSKQFLLFMQTDRFLTRHNSQTTHTKSPPRKLTQHEINPRAFLYLLKSTNYRNSNENWNF